MKAWFLRVWNDEEAFKGLVRASGKFVLTYVGFLAPLFVDSKAAWYLGPLFAAVGVSVPTKPLAPKGS